MSTLQNAVFVPTVKSRENKYKTKGEWLEFDSPVITSVCAMRGGGKTGISDYMMQRYYDKQFTVLHLFSARSLENLYPIINKNCGLHFDKMTIHGDTSKNVLLEAGDIVFVPPTPLAAVALMLEEFLRPIGRIFSTVYMYERIEYMSDQDRY